MQSRPNPWRRARLYALLVGGTLLPLTGCATKKDVRTLTAELRAMQLRQDSILDVMQRQNSVLLDSLRAAKNVTMDAQGQTSHRFQQLEGALETTQDLVGEVTVLVRELMRRLDELGAAPRAAPSGGVSSGGEPAEVYQLGLQKMGEGAYGTARAAFQSLLRESRDHELAPAAQYQIGETYAAEKEWEDAVEALENVAKEWPSAKEAPQALYRAGMIAADNLKQAAKARELLNRVVNGYAGAPEAQLARTKLRSLPR